MRKQYLFTLCYLPLILIGLTVSSCGTMLSDIAKAYGEGGYGMPYPTGYATYPASSSSYYSAIMNSTSRNIINNANFYQRMSATQAEINETAAKIALAGGSVDYGNSSSSSTSSSSKSSSNSAQNCTYCKGTGLIGYETTGLAFGTKTGRIYCKKCKSHYNNGDVHHHRVCTH